jgi:uncharacterized protein (TIGR03437 family)
MMVGSFESKMTLGTIAAVFVCVAAAPQVLATAVTLGPSNQSYGLTGIGPDGSGNGQSKVTWGTCSFDGTNTNCSLSGNYTSTAGGGTYNFVVSYAGNGAFPLIAVSRSPGSDLISYQAISNSSLVITLTPTNAAPISFYSFANFSFFFANPSCAGVATCGVGQVGLTPNATITGPVNGSFDPTPMITPSGVITASDFGGFQAMAPATWIEIFGINLATTLGQIWGGTDFKGDNAPTAVGGTTVTIGGKPAFLDYVSPGQVNVQAPGGLAAGPLPLVLTTAGGSSLPYMVNVNSVQPGLLSPASFRINGNRYVVAQLGAAYVLPSPVAGVLTLKAKPGDTVTLYGVGFGTVTPDNPAGVITRQVDALTSTFKISFAGVPATVAYAGLTSGFVGLYQFNVVIPSVAASDAVPLTFTVNGTAGSQALVIPISN